MKRQLGKQNLLETVKSESQKTFGMLDNLLKFLFGRDEANKHFMFSHQFRDAAAITDMNVAGVIKTVKQMFTSNQCLSLTNQQAFVPRYFGSDLSSVNDHVAVEYSDCSGADEQRQQVNVLITRMADFNRRNSVNYNFQIDEAHSARGDCCTINLLSSETFDLEAPVDDQCETRDANNGLKKTGSARLNQIDLDFGEIMVSRNSRTVAQIGSYQPLGSDESYSDGDLGLCAKLQEKRSTDTFDDFTLTFASTIRQHERANAERKGHYNVKRSSRK